MLIGMGSPMLLAAGGPLRIIAEDAGLVADNQDDGTEDFTVDVGVHEPGRFLVLCLTLETNSGAANACDFTSIAVDPAGQNIALTEIETASGSGASETQRAAIWAGDISAFTGSSVTVRVNWNHLGTTSIGLSAVAVSRPIAAAVHDSAAGTADGPTAVSTSAGVAAPAGALLVVAAHDDDHSAPGASSDVTEQADANSGGTGSHDHRHWAGWDVLAAGRASAVATVTFATSTDEKAICAAVWR